MLKNNILYKSMLSLGFYGINYINKLIDQFSKHLNLETPKFKNIFYYLTMFFNIINLSFIFVFLYFPNNKFIIYLFGGTIIFYCFQFCLIAYLSFLILKTYKNISKLEKVYIICLPIISILLNILGLIAKQYIIYLMPRILYFPQNFLTLTIFFQGFITFAAIFLYYFYYIFIFIVNIWCNNLIFAMIHREINKLSKN